MPTILTRDAILQAKDQQIELVPVPEWGKDAAVYVRGLTAAERDSYVGSSMQQRGKVQTVNYQNLSAKLCSMTICDAEGKTLFTASDVPTLAQKSAVALQRCFDVASRLSGLTDKDVEELAKGLEDDPFDGSPSV